MHQRRKGSVSQKFGVNRGTSFISSLLHSFTIYHIRNLCGARAHSPSKLVIIIIITIRRGRGTEQKVISHIKGRVTRHTGAENDNRLDRLAYLMAVTQAVPCVASWSRSVGLSATTFF